MVYPTPCYPLFESFIDYVGAVPVPRAPARGERISASPVRALEHVPDARRPSCVYLNFPSNPTGGVATAEQLARSGEVIQKPGAPQRAHLQRRGVRGHRLRRRKHVSIASLPGMEEMTIIATGASKTYSWTGGRVGWGVYPTVAEAKVMRRLNINYFASIPPYNQMGAITALESPESPPAIAAMVAAFQQRRDIVVAESQRHRRHHLPEPEGRLLRVPERGGRSWRSWAGMRPTRPSPRRSRPGPVRPRSSSCSSCTATDRRPWIGGRSASGAARGSTSCGSPSPTGEDDLREAVGRIADGRGGRGRLRRLRALRPSVDTSDPAWRTSAFYM